MLQLEDAEYATAAAVKARKGIEIEVQEIQQQLDAVSKSKQEVEDRCMNLVREKNDLQTQAEEGEEDMSDLMKKYKAAVQQLTIERTQIQEQTKQVEELSQEKQQLQEQVGADKNCQFSFLKACVLICLNQNVATFTGTRVAE